MNLETLITQAQNIGLKLDTESLKIHTELNNTTSLWQILEDFNPVQGWIQTTEHIISKDFLNSNYQDAPIEHAELINAQGQTLQIRPQNQQSLLTYFTPAQGEKMFLYTTRLHALKQNPDYALVYRVYFDLEDTRAPYCARLIEITKELNHA